LRADNEVFTLMYFGAHGPANGLDNLIKAMRIAEEKSQGRRILLRLIGDGPSKSELRELAADSAAIRFESAVPKANIPNVAAEADAFVICVRDLPQLYRFGISMNKIFDYMAAQRPVIISANAPNNPIEESGSGLTVQAENPDALASAILEMAEYSTELRQEMGVRGRRYLEEHYDMAILADRLSKTLDDCLRAS